jgi:hypothetical protein
MIMATGSVDTQGAQGQLNAISQQSQEDQVQNAKNQAQVKQFTDALETTKQLLR